MPGSFSLRDSQRVTIEKSEYVETLIDEVFAMLDSQHSGLFTPSSVFGNDADSVTQENIETDFPQLAELFAHRQPSSLSEDSTVSEVGVSSMEWHNYWAFHESDACEVALKRMKQKLHETHLSDAVLLGDHLTTDGVAAGDAVSSHHYHMPGSRAAAEAKNKPLTELDKMLLQRRERNQAREQQAATAAASTGPKTGWLVDETQKPDNAQSPQSVRGRGGIVLPGSRAAEEAKKKPLSELDKILEKRRLKNAAAAEAAEVATQAAAEQAAAEQAAAEQSRGENASSGAQAESQTSSTGWVIDRKAAEVQAPSMCT